MSEHIYLRGQITLDERTKKDIVYLAILRKNAPLSNDELAKEAHEHPTFRSKTLVAIEQDARRFVERGEAIGILSKRNGKIFLLLTQAEPQNRYPEPQSKNTVLNSNGFLTTKAAVTCDHCGTSVDLSKAKVRWRLKSRTLQLALHVHHFIRVKCDECGWEGRYDTRKDVKPLLT